MLRLISELCKSIAALNTNGMIVLLNAAKSIAGREKYRKKSGGITPEQFDRQVGQVINMLKKESAA